MAYDDQIRHVRFAFQGSALFEGRDDWRRYDNAESARKYATLCQQVLEQAYPFAKVEVIDIDLSGSSFVLARTQVNEQTDSIEIDAVEQLCDEVYSNLIWAVPRPWLNISQAHMRYRVPAAIIRRACQEGVVREAEKVDGRWEFPLDTFVEDLDTKTLVHCIQVVGISVTDDGAHRFECYPENVLDTRAIDFPPHAETLMVIAPNLGIRPFTADNCDLLISRRGDEIILTFELFSDEGRWTGRWTYDTYARELMAQAGRHKIENECVSETFIETVRLNFARPGSQPLSLHDLVARTADDLREIVQDTDLSLSGGPVWKKVYEKDESLFCTEVLAPLLRRMDFVSVRYIHGTREFGKDFVFSEPTKFGDLRHYGLQAKAGDVSGRINSELEQILGQIKDAFEMSYRELGEQTERYISTYIVAISGHFTENAQEKIRAMTPRGIVGSVAFWDKEKILTLIAHAWAHDED